MSGVRRWKFFRGAMETEEVDGRLSNVVFERAATRIGDEAGTDPPATACRSRQAKSRLAHHTGAANASTFPRTSRVAYTKRH